MNHDILRVEVYMYDCPLLFIITSLGMETSDFGSGSGPIFVEQPVCSGFEASILDCFMFFPVGVHGCDHSSDVGIRCLGLPVVCFILYFISMPAYNL